MNIDVTHWRRACAGLLLCAGLAIAVGNSAAAAPLVAGKPRLIANSKGRFDFLEIDAGRRRFLGCHTDNGTLDVFDLDSGQLLKQIATGGAQDVAVDQEAGKYYVGVGDEQIVAVIDSKSLEKISEIRLPGPSDAVLFNPRNHRLYVDQDDGTSVLVIDTVTEKIVATITIPEAPEYLVYDPVSDRIFQNIKSSDEVVVIDPSRNIVTAHWPTAPARSPHGLAIDPSTHRLFAAGKNSKLVVLDATSGKLVAAVAIASGVDQIAFDPGNKRLYCAGSDGIISVVQETAEGAVLLGNVRTESTGRTVTVDPKTHAVWTAYGDDSSSHVLTLVPP